MKHDGCFSFSTSTATSCFKTFAPQTAVAHNPPSNITSLPIGASLDGVVTSQIPQSNSVEIETHLGKLLLQSTADLGLDNYLQLMLQRKSPYLQFIIKNNLASQTICKLPSHCPHTLERLSRRN